tara:strand:- start:809 stop:1114 length:306 start_codon:yes stop_codon:yes gene_type:complete
MKLTESRIKEIILEEIQTMVEQEQQAQQQQNQPAGKENYSSSDLKQELVALGQKIQSVKGMDTSELKLISGIIGLVVSISSKKSGAAALKKVYDMLEKFDG